MLLSKCHNKSPLTPVWWSGPARLSLTSTPSSSTLLSCEQTAPTPGWTFQHHISHWVLRVLCAGECHWVWHRSPNEEQPCAISVGDIPSSVSQPIVEQPHHCSFPLVPLPWEPHGTRHWLPAQPEPWFFLGKTLKKYRKRKKKKNHRTTSRQTPGCTAVQENGCNSINTQHFPSLDMLDGAWSNLG